MSESHDRFVLFVGFALLIAICVVVCMKRRADCVAAGGHTVSVYRASLCVTPDGRIIEDY